MDPIIARLVEQVCRWQFKINFSTLATSIVYSTSTAHVHEDLIVILGFEYRGILQVCVHHGWGDLVCGIWLSGENKLTF